MKMQLRVQISRACRPPVTERVPHATTVRGGPVRLNDPVLPDKWISALIKPLPGLAAAY
jgi:hypothetical protein